MGLSNNLGTGELTLSTDPSETISGMVRTLLSLNRRFTAKIMIEDRKIKFKHVNKFKNILASHIKHQKLKDTLNKTQTTIPPCIDYS